VVWLVIGNQFLFNLFVGVIIDNFNLIKEELGGIRMLTGEQRTWVEIQKLFLKNMPMKMVRPPEGWTNMLWRIVKNYYFENFITLCIICNSVIMALKVFPPDPTEDVIFNNLN